MYSSAGSHTAAAAASDTGMGMYSIGPDRTTGMYTRNPAIAEDCSKIFLFRFFFFFCRLCSR